MRTAHGEASQRTAPPMAANAYPDAALTALRQLVLQRGGSESMRPPAASVSDTDSSAAGGAEATASTIDAAAAGSNGSGSEQLRERTLNPKPKKLFAPRGRT